PAETALYVPLFKQVALPLGAVFVVIAYFMVVGFSNAVNLTDGLDGLAIMPSVLVSGALGVFAYLAGNKVFSEYLGIPSIPGAGVRGGDRAPGDRSARDGRRVRAGDHLGDAAGGQLQSERQAHLPHGAEPPPLRAHGLAGAARDRALLDHQRRAGADRTCHA